MRRCSYEVSAEKMLAHRHMHAPRGRVIHEVGCSLAAQDFIMDNTYGPLQKRAAYQAIHGSIDL
jgi:hypothetical protein